jgi:hypothetical protein
MKRLPTAVLAASLASGVLLADPASADAGVPMLVLIWPAFWLLLAPIVLIEAVVACRRLALPMKQALKASLAANATSTLIGVPVTWAILLAMELLLSGGGRAFGLSDALSRTFAVTVQAPWLVPYEEDLHWMVPMAAAVLLVPFFFMSVAIEGWVMRRYIVGEKGEAMRWSQSANAITYGGMMAFVVTWAIVAGVRGG